jgi:adenosylcobinamide-phosphate guanylyltransferase
MTVTALVMAGGKGTRLALAQEKPLLQVGGKTVIDHILDVLKRARRVDNIVVAVSDFTPKTAAYLVKYPIKVLKTPGKEYVSDMGFAVKALKLQTVLTISADMPFITSETIDDIIEHYLVCGKPALVVVVPAETKQKLGMSVRYDFDFNGEKVVPSGINVNDGSRIEDPELDQAVYVIDKAEVAVNINTVEELKRAEAFFSKPQRNSCCG